METQPDWFDKGFDPNNISEYKTLSKTFTKWQKMASELSVSIHVASTGEKEGGTVEISVDIEWIFGKDVPDSNFEDPRENNLKPTLR